jgi:tetratricopeptide (TPR) repeat protein
MTQDQNFRCLAVRQPYAWAICAGAKDVENRSWSTDYRGDVVIVASSTAVEIKAALRDARPAKLDASHLATGAAIGIATLTDIVPLDQALESNPWASGPYCWKFANARFFEQPIPCKGKLRLYSADDEIAKKIKAELATARSRPLDVNGQAWIDALTKNQTEVVRLSSYVFTYFDLSDWDNLLRHLPRALEIDPGNFDLISMHGEALACLERLSEALAVFDDLVNRFPDEAAAYAQRALTYLDLGDQASADKDNAKALELNPHIFDAMATQANQENDDD